MQRTLKDRLIFSSKGWYDSLQEATYAINTAVSSTSENFPFEMVFVCSGWNLHYSTSINCKEFEVSNKSFPNDRLTVHNLLPQVVSVPNSLAVSKLSTAIVCILMYFEENSVILELLESLTEIKLLY